MSDNKDEFTTIASKTLAKILVRKLKPIEVKNLIEGLKKDTQKIVL